jgi:phospholipase C
MTTFAFSRSIRRYALCVSTAAAMLAGCGDLRQAQDATQPPIGAPGAMRDAGTYSGVRAALADSSHERDATRWPIQHLIVIVQQARSFDDLFAGYPGADAPTKGLTSTGKRVPLQTISLKRYKVCADGFLGAYFKTVYDGGKMDGWDLLDKKDPLCPYTRIDPSESKPYWDRAKQFSLADEMFASTRFAEFDNQLYIVAGTTKISPDAFDVGAPSNIPWGCHAPPGTTTSLLKNRLIEVLRGPYPCFTQFPTMANLLDGAGVSWKYYFTPDTEAPFNPFAAIKYVALGEDWKRNMSAPATNIRNDLSKGKLAAVSWVLSPYKDSDALGQSGGPHWVSSIITATENSRYWKRAAVVVVWDTPGDGNFYDDVAPPQLDTMGLGFRVPMIVVSPYAKRHFVSDTRYEFGSILKFIEENWSLGSLGATDRRAHSIDDMFDFHT